MYRFQRILGACTAAVLLVVLTGPIPAVSAEDGYRATVLITGSNRGIGLEFARQYAALDWDVIATARRPESATDLHALAGQYANVVIEQLDVTNEEHITTLAEKYSGQPIDILINNAGVGGRDTQLDTPYDKKDFRFAMDVNTFAPLRISQAFLDSILLSQQQKIMVMSSRMGSIKWAPSTAVDGPLSGGLYYAMSKAAVNMGMRRVAAAVRDKGVSVVIVSPGPTQTDMLMSKIAGLDPEQLRSPGDTTKKLQTTEEAVNGIISFLEAFDIEQSGEFFMHDGEALPW